MGKMCVYMRIYCVFVCLCTCVRVNIKSFSRYETSEDGPSGGLYELETSYNYLRNMNFYCWEYAEIYSVIEKP